MSLLDEAKKAMDTMSSIETTVLEDIIKAIDLSYINFLDGEGLTDHPTIKVGYFLELSMIIDEDPFPLTVVQANVMKYLGGTINEWADDYTEKIEALLSDAVVQTKS